MRGPFGAYVTAARTVRLPSTRCDPEGRYVSGCICYLHVTMARCDSLTATEANEPLKTS